MGLKLTLQKFLWHLTTEPAVVLKSLPASIKDIIEILYFYFSELSLTACYVILFIIAARFLLKNTPKIYSYALWGVVYFKLISVLKLDFFRHSLIPQPQIDKIYYNITPDYTAFYSTEAGIVSQINSNLVVPVPVVTPIYTPALIWFAVLCAIFAVSAVMYFIAYSRLKNSGLINLKDNVYISDAISTPFVLGIIRPKIYLPQGLNEQQQHYVITHEKVHIKRGDHIIKMFAFCITCIHWFNPLVWLSFFLMEKDMEMSCDEKVLQILGNEHKKDYSYCILSLSAGKKFVPKAYLSFGDSDTKKRIKNVLNYKKPAVIASAVAIIGIIVIAVGMLADSGIVYIPSVAPSSNENGITDNNFPNGFDSFFFTFSGYSTSVGINMPEGWSFKARNIQTDEYPEYLTLDDNFSDCFDIYNNKGENVGAMGVVSYTEYMGTENNLMAIYGAVGLPNMYNFDLNEHYLVADSDENGNWEKATTKVYHSPQLNRDAGKAQVATYGDGILAYNRECLVFVTIEFKEDYFSDGELKYIAQSLSIKPENSSFGTASALLNMQYRNMETGTDFDISEYVTEDVLALLKAKESIAKHRIRIFGTGKQSYNVKVIPFESENWVESENSADIKMQVLRTFRYNTSNYDSSSSEVVSLHLERYKTGYWKITHYSLDGKDLTLNDMDNRYWQAVEAGTGAEFLDEFVEEYKSFISNISSKPLVDKSNTTPFPVVNQWQFSTKCAATSTADKYVITYCDEKITCSTGLLTIENPNDFDISVHLLSSNKGEIVLDVLRNTSTAFALTADSAEYTVGVHADVKEDTEINLIVYENNHN